MTLKIFTFIILFCEILSVQKYNLDRGFFSDDDDSYESNEDDVYIEDT